MRALFVKNQSAAAPRINRVISLGDVGDKISCMGKTQQFELFYALGSFNMPFPIPALAMGFLFANPQPDFPGLPPYFAGNFGRNFPKVLTSITGKDKFSVMLWLTSAIHTLYMTKKCVLH